MDLEQGAVIAHRVDVEGVQGLDPSLNVRLARRNCLLVHVLRLVDVLLILHHVPRVVQRVHVPRLALQSEHEFLDGPLNVVLGVVQNAAPLAQDIGLPRCRLQGLGQDLHCPLEVLLVLPQLPRPIRRLPRPPIRIIRVQLLCLHGGGCFSGRGCCCLPSPEPQADAAVVPAARHDAPCVPCGETNNCQEKNDPHPTKAGGSASP
mmetsp:Transcript_32140/g.78861  ORF Transcript_32140/g.78861 Transcript_32140/m.78861 type:complete len:205 (+) Transcript_32140:591-1205(+)